MTVQRIGRTCAMAAVVLLSVTACGKDSGPFLAPVEPLAYTRFVSAVPDTTAMDWRFVDAIKNSPFALGLAFRGFSPYQATTPGARHLRLFPTSTDITITSQIVKDVTLTFEERKYYTIVHVGLARVSDSDANADKIVVFEDAPPATTGAQIVLRVINLGPGLNGGAPTPVDVFATTAVADPTPATPLFPNVAYLAATAYVTRPTGAFALRATTAGTTTPVLANILANPGVAADPALTGSAIGGSTQAGSALTAFIFPRTTAGSSAPQSGNDTKCVNTAVNGVNGVAFTSPEICYLVDRRPQ